MAAGEEVGIPTTGEDTRYPNRYDLDKITTDIPMFYTRACAHVIAVNSKALEVMGVTRDTKQIPGGSIAFDDDGEPLGIFYGGCQRPGV